MTRINQVGLCAIPFTRRHSRIVMECMKRLGQALEPEEWDLFLLDDAWDQGSVSQFTVVPKKRKVAIDLLIDLVPGSAFGSYQPATRENAGEEKPFLGRKTRG